MSQPILVRSVRITCEERFSSGEKVASVTGTIAVNDDAVALKGNPAALVNPGVYLHRDDVIRLIQERIDGHTEGDEEIWALESIRDDIATRGAV